MIPAIHTSPRGDAMDAVATPCVINQIRRAAFLNATQRVRGVEVEIRLRFVEAHIGVLVALYRLPAAANGYRLGVGGHELAKRILGAPCVLRSEERRVGKECRSRWE